MTEDEYTPTTDEVQEVWAAFSEYGGIADRPKSGLWEDRQLEFERWLETEREAVRREKRPELDAHELASLIWETSRADEGTISATGALIVAHAIINSGRTPSDDIERCDFDCDYCHG